MITVTVVQLIGDGSINLQFPRHIRQTGAARRITLYDGDYIEFNGSFSLTPQGARRPDIYALKRDAYLAAVAAHPERFPAGAGTAARFDAIYQRVIATFEGELRLAQRRLQRQQRHIAEQLAALDRVLAQQD